METRMIRERVVDRERRPARVAEDRVDAGRLEREADEVRAAHSRRRGFLSRQDRRHRNFLLKTLKASLWEASSLVRVLDVLSLASRPDARPLNEDDGDAEKDGDALHCGEP